MGLPAGLWMGHTGAGRVLGINLANVGRAIPSYAVLAMILPVSLSLAPTLGYKPGLGLSFIPVFGAMTLLAIPPILVGAYAGIRSVDQDLVESARGMGMQERQILFGIELPLASPIVVGGIRTALLQVIGTATIGAIVVLRRPGPLHHRRHRQPQQRQPLRRRGAGGGARHRRRPGARAHPALADAASPAARWSGQGHRRVGLTGRRRDVEAVG